MLKAVILSGRWRRGRFLALTLADSDSVSLHWGPGVRFVNKAPDHSDLSGDRASRKFYKVELINWFLQHEGSANKPSVAHGPKAGAQARGGVSETQLSRPSPDLLTQNLHHHKVPRGRQHTIP